MKMDLLLCVAALTQNCNAIKSQVCTELGSPFPSNKDLSSAVCRYLTVQYFIAALMFTISGNYHGIRQKDLKEHSYRNQLELFAGTWHVGTPLKKEPDLQHLTDLPQQNSWSFCILWHIHKFCNHWARSPADSACPVAYSWFHLPVP